jgi:hypothetical protein
MAWAVEEAGLHIEGTTHELAVSERDGELLFQVPLSGVDTGIGLRNRDMGVPAGVEEMLLTTATELMLRQCCAPPFNSAKPSSTSRNHRQLDSRHSAGLCCNPLVSLELLGPVSIFES